MVKLIAVFALAVLPMLAMGTICPDKESRCPSTSTCCQTSSHGYGCCPYVNATCCSDHSHCCPSHLKCDVEKSRCVSESSIPAPLSLPMDSWNEIGETTVLSTVEVDVKKKICPDGVQRCPDTYTCCALKNNVGYGCCPEKDGVCCADGVHCCPKGSSCNLASGRCDRQ